MVSDGPVDQFGVPKGRKLGSIHLQAFLAETATLSIEVQEKSIDRFLNDWMKNKTQLQEALLVDFSL